MVVVLHEGGSGGETPLEVGIVIRSHQRPRRHSHKPPALQTSDEAGELCVLVVNWEDFVGELALVRDVEMGATGKPVNAVIGRRV
mmetsp:Transcript_2412/g.5225  ORF Transcript_2412/g.5225 Transcript_2412/m.5225 type:complete len:85 (-) Transcript_2412:220-474(-)